jgi:hypothetical protein
MTNRTGLERLFVALEEARRIEKKLDRRDVSEDGRRGEKIASRFAADKMLASS